MNLAQAVLKTSTSQYCHRVGYKHPSIIICVILFNATCMYMYHDPRSLACLFWRRLLKGVLPYMGVVAILDM